MSMGKHNLSAKKRGMKQNLNALENARKIFIQQKAGYKARKALLRMVRDHKVENRGIGDKMYCNSNKEKERRRTAKGI